MLASANGGRLGGDRVTSGDEAISGSELVRTVLDNPRGGVERLVALTAGQEVDWLEFKRAFREHENDTKPRRASLAWHVTKAIVAMMNTRGGAVIVGYGEDEGVPAFPVGLKQSDPDGVLSGGSDPFLRKVAYPTLLPTNGRWKTEEGTFQTDVERLNNRVTLDIVKAAGHSVLVCLVTPIAEGEPLLTVIRRKNKDEAEYAFVRKRGMGEVRTLKAEALPDYERERRVRGSDLKLLRTCFLDHEVDLSRLAPPCDVFQGRLDELAQLDSIWQQRNVRVACVVGSGGEGKTSLVSRWLNQLSQRGFEGARRVYGWSFLNQGIDGKETSADDFFESTLEFFRSSTESHGAIRDRGRQLAQLIGAGPNLLVLDGMEPLLQVAGPNDGHLRDPALRSFFMALAHQHHGLCVITTRRALGGVAGQITTRELPLAGLSHDCGVALLKALGVNGPLDAIRTAANDLGGHALSLNLLGTYLRDRHRGNIHDRNRAQLNGAPTPATDHAHRMLASYVEWFKSSDDEVARVALAVMRLLGLFNRPVRRSWLQALRRQPIPGFTEGLFLDEEGPPSSTGGARRIPTASMNGALTRLAQARLIHDGNAESIDCHPIIRWYFREELRCHFPSEAKSAHAVMFDHLRLQTNTEHQPDDGESMDALYHAVIHGARSGQLSATLTEVYKARIQRHSEFFAIGQLGMLGDDLAALESFFEVAWEQPESDLSLLDQAYVLNQAGILLWPIGQLEEAQIALAKGLDIAISIEHGRYASAIAGNLAQLSLIRGDVAQAIAFARQGVALAEDDFSIVDSHRRLGAALHRRGDFSDAERAFRLADDMEARGNLHHPDIYCSRWGALDDLLLDQGRYQEAKARLTHSVLAPVKEAAFDVALNQLRLGRALTQEALHRRSDTNWEAAKQHLTDGLEVLEQQRDPIWERVSEGHLYLAQLYRSLGEPDDARRHLEDAESCAARYDGAHSIPACIIPVQIERARLHRLAGVAAKAKRVLQEARAQMLKTGFRCFAPALEQLSAQLETDSPAC